MFHVADNFKRLFSRRAATEFNKVAAFLNNLCGGDFLHVERPEVPTADKPPRVSLRFDALAQRFVSAPVPDGRMPDERDFVEIGSAPDDELEQDGELLWEAGCGSDALLLVFYQGEADADAGTHKLYAAKIVVNRNGTIGKIVSAENRGIEIGA